MGRLWRISNAARLQPFSVFDLRNLVRIAAAGRTGSRRRPGRRTERRRREKRLGNVMTLVDHTLIGVFAALAEKQRRVVADHLRGRVTDDSRELIRRIRASLKRKARNRLPARLKWLG